jgi:hypothetical protein
MRSLKYEPKSTALREALRGNADHALTLAEQTSMAEWLDRSERIGASSRRQEQSSVYPHNSDSLLPAGPPSPIS